VDGAFVDKQYDVRKRAE